VGASDAGYGVIGGATGAVLSPVFASLVRGGDPNLNDIQRAVITGLSMLAGGSVAAALGQDALSGADAAQNETLNNCVGHPDSCTTLLKDWVTSWPSDPGMVTAFQLMDLYSGMPSNIGPIGQIEGAASPGISAGEAKPHVEHSSACREKNRPAGGGGGRCRTAMWPLCAAQFIRAIQRWGDPPKGYRWLPADHAKAKHRESLHPSRRVCQSTPCR
jgi:hypothetical protein